jgi:pyruvate-formate lyase-activating enzyme
MASQHQIQAMLDAVVRNEAQPDVVQISGGEPTLHPDFFAILDMAKARPIRHVMVNTNGVRVAHEEEFASRLSGYMPDLEVYLQFDSFERQPLMELRGADLRNVRERALARLNRHKISTTLVVTLKKGLNDCEIGKIIDFALQHRCVRGVTFQPIQAAGRLEHYDPATDRLTLTEVRRKILEQTTVFRPEDIPVPCHADSLAMAYALKLNGRVIPLTGMIDPEVLINGGRNTIVYEQDDAVRNGVFKLFATNHSPRSGAGSLRDLLVRPESDARFLWDGCARSAKPLALLPHLSCAESKTKEFQRSRGNRPTWHLCSSISRILDAIAHLTLHADALKKLKASCVLESSRGRRAIRVRWLWS